MGRRLQFTLAMRSLAALVTSSCLLTGCYSFISNPSGKATPRREGADIVVVATTAIVLGAVVTGFSIYGLEHSERAVDNGGQLDGVRVLSVVGAITGGLALAAGTADEGVGLYQMISGDDAFPPRTPGE
jgi:hypothetical protein